MPTSFPDIVAKFKKDKNVLFHSSVMFDKNRILEMGGYDTSLACMEDFDLYVRLCRQFQIANMDERLALKRIHEGQFFDGRDGMHFKPEAQHALATIRRRISLLEEPS